MHHHCCPCYFLPAYPLFDEGGSRRAFDASILIFCLHDLNLRENISPAAVQRFFLPLPTGPPTELVKVTLLSYLRR